MRATLEYDIKFAFNETPLEFFDTHRCISRLRWKKNFFIEQKSFEIVYRVEPFICKWEKAELKNYIDLFNFSFLSYFLNDKPFYANHLNNQHFLTSIVILSN